MKGIVTLKLCLVLSFLGVCFLSYGQETQTEGHFNYLVKMTGNIKTITIKEYTGSDSILIIPSTILNIPVTEIGEKAFMMKKNIVEVVLPDMMECIGEMAFYNCSNLRKINIPVQLRKIDWGAFDDSNDEIINGMDDILVNNLISRFTKDIFFYPEDITFSATYNPDNAIGDIGMAGVGTIISRDLIDYANLKHETTDGIVFETKIISISESKGVFTVTLAFNKNGNEIYRTIFSLRSKQRYNYITYIYIFDTEKRQILTNFIELGDPVETSVRWINPFLDMIYTFYNVQRLFID